MPGGGLTLRVPEKMKLNLSTKIRGGSRILCYGERMSAKDLGTVQSPAGPEQSPARVIPGAKARRKLLGFEYLGSFSVNNLKHFVNVMRCIKSYKTHESSPKSFKQCKTKLKGDVTCNYLSGAVTPLISLSRRVFVYSEQVRTP